MFGLNTAGRQGRLVLKHMAEADIFATAAQIAYFLLLSLFPLLLFLITLLGYLPIDTKLFAEFLSGYAPHEVTLYIQDNLAQIAATKNGRLLSLGIIGTFWSASNGINALMKAMNRAYGIRESRTYLVSRLLSLGLTAAMLGLILIALLLPIFGKMLGMYIFSFFGLSEDFLVIWNMLRWVLSSLIFFLILSVLYKLAPNRFVRLKDTVWGAALATLAWQTVSLGFSFYVTEIAHYSVTYGGLGAVIMLLVWFYISGIIILAGGTFNAFLAAKKEAAL